MAYTDILFEIRNQIAWLTINRPDKGNTFRRQTVLEMTQALNEATADESRVLSETLSRLFRIK